MKKIVSIFVIGAFFFFSTEGIAQQLTSQQQQAVNKLFKTSNVVYFKFNVHSMQEIPDFGKLFTVDKAKGAQVSAHANKAQFTQFIRMNYAYTVIPGGGAKKATKKVPTKAPAKVPVKKK